jgi:hypothetical protein
MDWQDLHLSRRSRAFNLAHRWVKVVAIVVGFPVTTLCLMIVVGRFAPSFNARAAAAIAITLAVPAITAWALRPHEDPLGAVGMPSEVYAVLLLGFAVVFVVALQGRTRGLLLREGDRALCEGQSEMARAAWWLGGVKASSPRSPAPCGAGASR